MYTIIIITTSISSIWIWWFDISRIY